MSGSHHVLMGSGTSGSGAAEGQGGNSEGTYSSGGKNWKWHKFTSNGTFTWVSEAACDILVVAGGGGGGHSLYHNGGAGGGGVLHATDYTLAAGSYSITVGNGGAGGTKQGGGGGNPRPAPYNNGGSDTPGFQGQPSSFGSIATAYGGGYGGTWDGTPGGHGGSGGGGWENGASGRYGGQAITSGVPSGFTRY